MNPAAPTKASVDPHTACAHCGLPVGRRPVGDDPYFCCTGCAVVYDALRDAGLDDTYYRLRGVAEEREAQPAQTELDGLMLSEIDSAAFLAEHTRLVDNRMRATELFLDGVHCAACVWLVERMPQAVDGVTEARLDLPRARLSLQWRPEDVSLSEIARWLATFGYAAQPVRRDASTQRTEAERRLLVKVGVTWALAGNVMLLAFALYAGLDVTTSPGLAEAARWLSMALAVPAILYGGSEFFRRAWSSFRFAVRTRQLRALHMDTPIALGISVGFADSAWSTVTDTGEVWFDSITVLIAALLTARWLQLRSRRLAGDASERLLSLIPTMARRMTVDELRTSNGSVGPSHPAFETVPVDELVEGDVVVVPAGEVFPVDGVIVTGETAVNNAVLTGESRPEAAAAGATVAAGATNVRAPVQVRVEAAGEGTRVGQLLAWMRNADHRRADVVLLADRIGGYFVAAVVGLAVLTAALWGWLDPASVPQHVVALLVITCPCALGMATPLAMAVASGKAARAGIFIKSDEATQLLTEVDTIVLDKTGTVTEGTMTLVDFEGDEAAVDLAAALEAHSNHPIAAALVRARAACSLDGTAVSPEADLVEVTAGQGIEGLVDGRYVIVGRPAWVWSRTERAFEPGVDAYAEQGYTPVAVAVDGRPAALLAFGDRVREETAELLAAMQADGKAVYLLSGDHPEVVQAVAVALGISASNAHGAVSPEEKQAFVERLQAEGRTVAMVGDGVNDAAALRMADVGVAVHGGSTASLVAADVFLTREGLRPVADLFDGVNRVMHVIRRNLGLSLIYNIGGATAAIAGLVGPLGAAVAMPISSLVVVASSILQRSFRPAPSAHRRKPAGATAEPVRLRDAA